MNLVIVESPAKAKTIQKYLGKGFIVKSSYGHIRDLPKKELGVDTEKNFTPKYIIPEKARAKVKELKTAAAKAKIIYFATDEDREGEAIAWHLLELLKPKKNQQVKRITFAEITKTAIQNAIKNPRDIDLDRVDAQQARRVLDRLVGYELSPLLWKKIRRGLSAGRVQSVAVRLIVEREDEIGKFKATEYWTLDALLNHQNQDFTARLFTAKGKKIPKLGIKSKAEIDTFLSGLEKQTYEIFDVQSKQRKRSPSPPYTTSTLQQAAVNRLGYSGKRTMLIAQQLYEGIDLGEQGPTGLITYMRTDSVNLSNEATTKAKEIIESKFGPEYFPSEPRKYQTKSKGAQEAHEAIRPTDPTRTPEEIASFLSSDQLKIYRLIWQRMVASQMKDALMNTVTVLINAGPYVFKATGSTISFDGFMKAIGLDKSAKETILPEMKTGDQPDLKELRPEQHFTQPPARYSEATLVKALEEHGIGRPSTYAPTIDTIQHRQYVEKNNDKKFAPTEVGTIVTRLLIEHFPNIVDLEFTAKMEENLDLIAAGKKKWQPVIGDFYHPFHTTLLKKEKEIDKKALTEQPTGEKCPDCGNEMVIKLGRFGRFKACSNYPECKHTEPIGEEKELQNQATGEKCPDCGKDLVLKRGRFGPFLGCSGYPECKHIKKVDKSTGVNCPKCKTGEIVEKKSRRGKLFFACNRYPDCANAYWSKPTGETCPDCQSLLVFGAKNTIRCSNKECRFTKPAD